MNTVDLHNAVTCIVRTAGERTEDACARLLDAQLGGTGRTLRIGGKPFPDTLADALQCGLDAGRPWTLHVDADVLPFPGAVGALLEAAESFGEETCEIQGLVFDRLFGGWRPAGVHLYRTRHLPRAIALLHEVAGDIRPETSVLQRLQDEGLRWHQLELGFGLHDFEQHPHDVHRKAFVHAWKHVALLPRLVGYWRARREEADFTAALRGLAAGIAHVEAVALDRDAPYFQAPAEPPLPWPAADPQEPRRRLAAEEAILQALGYRAAPVWDWAESRWAERRATLAQAIPTLLEQGVHTCAVDGGTTVARRALAAGLTAWGIRVSDKPHATSPTISWHPDDYLLLTTGDGTRVPCRPQPATADTPAAAARLVARLRQTGVSGVLVYGAGANGLHVLRAASAGGLTVRAFLESAPTAGEVHGHPLLTPEAALARFPTLPVVVASLASAPVMTTRLLAAEPAGTRPIWVLR